MYIQSSNLCVVGNKTNSEKRNRKQTILTTEKNVNNPFFGYKSRLLSKWLNQIANLTSFSRISLEYLN